MPDFSKILGDPSVRALIRGAMNDEVRRSCHFLDYVAGAPGTLSRITWDARGVPGVCEVTIADATPPWHVFVKVRPKWWVRLIPLGRWRLCRRVAARIEWQRRVGVIYDVKVTRERLAQCQERRRG